MGRTRRTVAAEPRSPRRRESRRVVVCAHDFSMAGHIRSALTRAGHTVTATCPGLLDLTDDPSLSEADLAVVALNPAREATHLAVLRRQHPGVPVIAVVPTLCGADSGRLLAAGIDGVVLADQIDHVLGPAIASLAADQLCVPSGALPALAGPVFSHREKQVLKLLLDGLTNSEIASRLYLSESTVKSHLSSSFRKLGVSSRGEVMRRAHGADAGLRHTLQVARDQGGARPVMA
jgi:DNA-binding NarL/FixJ family response regulator